MSDTERCAPPEGTPAGTLCMLQIGGGYLRVTWTGANWHRQGSVVNVSPAKLWRDGFRFVRVVENGDG